MFDRRYFLQLELNKNNHMIFAINEDKGGYNEIIGYLFLEDLNRAGNPNDFSFLDPVFLTDWDDNRNLIVANIITFDVPSEQKKDELLFLASTMIEFKPGINHKVEVLSSTDFKSFCLSYWEENSMGVNLPIYQYLIENFSENKIELSGLAGDSFSHLAQ